MKKPLLRMLSKSLQSHSCGVVFFHRPLGLKLCWWIGPFCKAHTRKLITQSQTTLTLFQNARELCLFQKIFWEKKITSISVYNMAAIKKKKEFRNFQEFFFRSFQKPYQIASPSNSIPTQRDLLTCVSRTLFHGGLT